MIKKLLVSLSVLTLTAISSTAFAAPATNFTLTDNNGAKINLSDYKGQVVYLDFWASWCGPCKQSFPAMNDFQKKYGAQGFKVIAVNVDENKQDAVNFLKTTPAQFTVVYDSNQQVIKQYNVKSMPSSFLIDKQGNILETHQGFKLEEVAELDAKIQKALK